MKARRIFGIIAAALLVSTVALTQATSQRSPQRPKTEAPEVQPQAPNQQEVEALRADLRRMRVLLNQMQVNLAFVQTSDTPLKHEFDLNNEMWQILVNDMDRRLQKMEAPKP